MVGIKDYLERDEEIYIKFRPSRKRKILGYIGLLISATVLFVYWFMGNSNNLFYFVVFFVGAVLFLYCLTVVVIMEYNRLLRLYVITN